MAVDFIRQSGKTEIHTESLKNSNWSVQMVLTYMGLELKSSKSNLNP